MGSVIEAAIKHFQMFAANGMYLGIFFMGILYLLAEKKNQENRSLFCVYTALFVFLYWFPVTAYIIMEYCVGELVYWRMFWILPIWIVISYVLVEWQDKIEKKIWKSLFAVAAIGVLVCAGKAVYSSENFQKAENHYKIPQTVVEICDDINEDAQAMEIENIKAVVPNELLIYIRQYDANIRMPYGRNALQGKKLKKNNAYIYQSMSSLSYQWETFAEKLKEEECNYFVCSNIAEDSQEIQNYGFEQIWQTENYTIYRLRPKTGQ